MLGKKAEREKEGWPEKKGTKPGSTLFVKQATRRLNLLDSVSQQENQGDLRREKRRWAYRVLPLWTKTTQGGTLESNPLEKGRKHKGAYRYGLLP